MPMLTRRHALAAGAALPFAGGLNFAVRPAHAQAEMMTGNALKNGFTMGDFEVSTLMSGTRTVPDPHSIFGLNVDDATFEEASRGAFIPSDKAQFFFTPTVVDTGSEVVLFDTGTAPGGTLAALKQAGYAADDVGVVVITHMHGDHIGGLAGEDGTETFKNARYVTGQAEFDYWSTTGDETFEAKVRPLAEKFEFIDDGATVAPGITGMAAFGHTPGHMTFMVESGGQSILIFADTANHYVWSIGHPDWEVSFDVDQAKAAETRKRVLGMLAADRIPLIGYHMPFPARGYVEANGDGFRYVPMSYQFMLEG